MGFVNYLLIFAFCSFILLGARYKKRPRRWRKPMSLSQSLLPEFDQEMAGTRRTLERVPENKFTWKPHEKSGTMIWLADHLANIPEWAVYTIQKDSLDMEPNGVKMSPPPLPKTSKELLDLFDKNRAARDANVSRL